MRSLSRYSLSSYYLETAPKGAAYDFVRVYNNLLKDIESDFLTDDELGFATETVEYEVLYSKIKYNVNNASRLQNYKFSFPVDAEDFDTKQKAQYYLFARYLRAIRYMGNNYYTENSFSVKVNEFAREDKPQVFLSHAYADKIYTILLFYYFYVHGIYLYVDWMHQEKQTDGRVLKRTLQKELSDSCQLLFLRSANSEMNIRGKHHIRPWCSWELGNFYSLKHSCEKYFLNLYSVDGYADMHLDGMKLLKGIVGGKLV